MEKRALLAFVASILLFLAYDAFYLSPRVEEQRQRRAAELESQRQAQADTLPVDTARTKEDAERRPSAERELPEKKAVPEEGVAGAGLESRAEAGLPSASGEESRQITIVSPLYEITLSTAGAEVVSAKLLRYQTEDKPVELVAQNADWTHSRMMNLTLEGQTAAIPLSGVGFTAQVAGVGNALHDGARVTVDPARGATEIVFRAARNGGGAIERYYRFYADRYDFDAGVRFSTADFPDITGVAWGLGPGLRSTETNVRDDQQNFRAAVKLGEEIHRLKPGHFDKNEKEEYSGTLGWASVQTKYFMVALIPPEPTRATVSVTGSKKDFRVSESVTLPAVTRQGSIDQSVRLYMGPLEYKILGQLDVGLDKNIEMGWRLIRPVSWVVLWSLTWMYRFIPNYGLVIIIISVLTKVLFYRLTHKSFKSMKEMQALQPKIQALKEKYGDDRQKLSQETMKMYKEAGVNPLGGCLPMLLQMPVFIALFNVLRYTIELRRAPFVGWIDDLSQQDVLFTLPVSLPLIGNAFSLLPILMGVSMFVQTKIGGSLTGSPGTQSTPKGFNTMLPIVFTFLFYKMPSGLVIYWIINTVLSVAQQYYIHREPQEPEEEAVKSPAPVQKRRRKTKGR
jgi:YidC/Oxa1 family membrane protein insertase